jgi:hypothetical protein
MPDGRSEFDQDIAKFETPGRACRQAVPEWPVFAQSGRLLRAFESSGYGLGALGGRRLSPRSDGELPHRASSEGHL